MKNILFFAITIALNQSCVTDSANLKVTSVDYSPAVEHSVVHFSSGKKLEDFGHFAMLSFVGQFEIPSPAKKPYHVFLFRTEQESSDTGPSLVVLVYENNERSLTGYPTIHKDDETGKVTGSDRVFYGKCLSNENQVVDFWDDSSEKTHTYNIEKTIFREAMPSPEKLSIDKKQFEASLKQLPTKDCKELK